MARRTGIKIISPQTRYFFRLSLTCLLASTVQLSAIAQEVKERFAPGDILKISAYGRDDLTGQYSVQPGPLVSLPLIGTVNLENHTVRQLEDELAKAWENRLGGAMSVTIEFAQRAPFYVIGDVNSPGAYPYRQGMNILQAIAASGGLERRAFSDNQGKLEVIRERERRMQALEKLGASLVRRARLIAEREGKDQISLEAPFTLLGSDRMNQLLAEERAILLSRTKQFSLKEELLSDQIKLGETELAAYQRQFDTLDKQQDQIIKEAARGRRIPGQQARVFELEQRSATLEATKASLRASISRSKATVTTAESELAQSQEQRRSELAEAFLQVDKEISEAVQAEVATREILDSAGFSGTGPSMVFKIMRAGSSNLETITSTSAIYPGDLLEVSYSIPTALVPIVENR